VVENYSLQDNIGAAENSATQRLKIVKVTYNFSLAEQN